MKPWELELSRCDWSLVPSSARVLTAVRGLATDAHPEPFADFLEVWLDHQQPIDVLETLSRTLVMMLPNPVNHDQVLFVLACVVGTQSQHPGPFVVTPEAIRVCQPMTLGFANIVAGLHRPTVRAQASAIDLLSFMFVVGLRAEAALQLEAALDQLAPECREVAVNTLASLRD